MTMTRREKMNSIYHLLSGYASVAKTGIEDTGVEADILLSDLRNDLQRLYLRLEIGKLRKSIDNDVAAILENVKEGAEKA